MGFPGLLCSFSLLCPLWAFPRDELCLGGQRVRSVCEDGSTVGTQNGALSLFPRYNVIVLEAEQY